MSHIIDHIFYINLERRHDRRVEIEDELNNFGLKFERFPAISHKLPFVGCSQSHLKALRLARYRGYKNVLILEDDFEFLVSKEELDHRLSSFFEKTPHYDVLMFSYNLPLDKSLERSDVLKQSEDMWETDTFGCKRVLDAQTASGYLVNGHYYDALISLYEEAFPLLEATQQHWIYMNDVIWKVLQKKDAWYCLTPRIGKQRESYSDLAGKVVDYGV